MGRDNNDTKTIMWLIDDKSCHGYEISSQHMGTC